jgi:hypothetical protein
MRRRTANLTGRVFSKGVSSQRGPAHFLTLLDGHPPFQIAENCHDGSGCKLALCGREYFVHSALNPFQSPGDLNGPVALAFTEIDASD